MFIAIGGAFAFFSTNYELGTPARMGPGYFPMMLGILLAILGVIISWQSFAKTSEKTEIAPTGWREILLILASVAVFGFTLPSLGMVVAVTLMILISSVAAYDFVWKETLISVVVLLILSYLVFVKGLELQFPVWPKFLTA